MGDRSDDVTTSRDSRSTDELLEETERLLSGEHGSDASQFDGATSHSPEEPDATADESDTWRRSSSSDASATDSRLGSIRSRLSISRYFSPKAFLALVLAIGIGLLVGGFAVPIAGRIAGMFAVAFALGLASSRGRYLEVAVAGVSVGGVAAVLNHLVLAVAGSGRAVVAVGASVGLVTCLLGYYFGRDLRAGLVRDVE
ncbi:DUF456 domain-containing protein [Natribaculum luteum]|uniref:DUF456 domain-containing protein n=1 Tax=Natribaculum luteum TaxID=1586232 RepID=A0ABD5P3G6_9EURY|nr:DUF456 domain-containing protein [Natribaculum luteum]